MENDAIKRTRRLYISYWKNTFNKEAINIATKYLKLNVKWIGKGLNEKLIDKSSKKIIIRINKNFSPI